MYSFASLPRNRAWLVFAPLALQPLYLLPVSLGLGPITIDLLLLLVIGVLLSLHLIAYQRACAEAERSTNSGTAPG